MNEQEAEIIVARLTKDIFDKEKIIREQEQEIESLLSQVKSLKAQAKALQPVVNAWFARQRPPNDDYYAD